MGPAVWLDASPWLAAHPDKSLVACFAGQCQKLGAQQAIGELVQGNGDLGKPQPLTVSTAGDFPKPVFSTRATLKDVVVHGACGDVNLWGLNARVNADGQVAILGWSGSSLRPATTVPSPTTTPAFGR